MTKDELLAVLRLQHIPHIGDTTAKKLIAYCGSPTAVFTDKIDHLLRIEGIGPFTLRELHNPVHLVAAEHEMAYIERADIRWSYFMDDTYPHYLKHCIDSPLLVFLRGKMQLQGRRIISVVGTRNITAYGRAFCEQFIEEIAPMNPVIVSGMAYGVDICVQRAAMAHKLQTVSCLAHGLNQMYPRPHQKYVAGIEANGGFITEFWSSSKPEREHFLQRNRIIAGMSEATVVVESAQKGGSLVTADIAGSYNREVFAVPGRTGDPYSVGCNTLIKQHKAHLLTSAADLIYLLGWNVEEKTVPVIQKQLFVDLDVTEETIHAFLLEKGRQLLDNIALECKLPVSRASASLLQMEMKGLIRPLPGKFFEIA